MAQEISREQKIWRELLIELKNNRWTDDRLKPYQESFIIPLRRFLADLSKADFSAQPEIFVVGGKIHYLVPQNEETFCFTILTEGNTWYFQHMENVFIRLDKIKAPASQFPDMPSDKKIWVRNERDVSFKAKLFGFLKREKGKAFALDYFKDGKGYFLEAQTWVPFTEPAKAFILYMCWEQANLDGNKVTLEKLERDEAIVRFRPVYFDLYARTAHIAQTITREDYRDLFEAVWQDRARSAGWALSLKNKEGEYIFVFKKP